MQDTLFAGTLGTKVRREGQFNWNISDPSFSFSSASP